MSTTAQARRKERELPLAVVIVGVVVVKMYSLISQCGIPVHCMVVQPSASAQFKRRHTHIIVLVCMLI
jgi:hypothetical protein